MTARAQVASCLALVLALPLVLGACGEAEYPLDYDRDRTFSALGLPGAEGEAALDEALGSLATVPIDPPPDVGRDYNPVFPPPLPFDPSEWLTNDLPTPVADPRAQKGGRIVLATPAWPPTIRTEGPNSRLAFLSDIHVFVYETLVSYSMEIEDYVPSLATHWQIDDDRMTFRFRLDERARWADGREVTADDVVATVEHLLNPDRKDPLVQKYWSERIEYARMLDKHTVEIKAQAPRWRLFMTIGWGMLIYPAAYIRMDGATYLDEWNWRLPPGTGPYEVRPEDIKKGRSITMRRRKDYWGKDFPENAGAYNFDEIEWKIVREQELMYQKLLAGEIDLYRVSRAQRWVDELDRETVIQMGWVQKRKVYNLDPQGYGGYCFNMRQPPFDDRRTRLAFAHLFNREKLFAKFFFYQYEYIDSYFPGQVWARPDAERIRFDPERAQQLLAEAGWTDRDAEGYLVNARGERFPSLTLEFAFPSFQRIHEVVKYDLWNEAGIEMELKLLDYAQLLKNVWEYKFKVIYWGWTANLFPEPEQQFHSKYADPLQTNNLNGLKNEEVDRIVTDYTFEYDPAERRRMLRRLDEILFDTHIYALGWYAPFFRVIYWDKFGHPPEYAARYTRDYRNIMAFWWYDGERERRMMDNKSKGLPNYPASPFYPHQYDETEPEFWLFHEAPMSEEEDLREQIRQHFQDDPLFAEVRHLEVPPRDGHYRIEFVSTGRDAADVRQLCIEIADFAGGRLGRRVPVHAYAPDGESIVCYFP